MRNLVKALREVEERVSSVYGSIEDLKAFRVWKGRKVIPKDEWRQLGRSKKDRAKALATFPDDYIPYTGITDDKWYRDYIELMQKAKNANYGKTLCSSCILNPDMQDRYGIKHVLIDAIDEDERPEVPCRIVNRLECPYLDGKKGYSDIVLENLGIIYKTIDDAVSKAVSLVSKEYNEYWVDFETGRVRTKYWYGGEASSTGYPIELEIGGAFSELHIRDKNELFNAITNRDSLAKLLDQQFSTEHDPDNEHNAKIMQVILDLFDEIKDTIRIEDLNEIRTCQEIEAEIKDREVKLDFKVAKGSCMYCNAVANIYDTNCDRWICYIHWREHQRTSHAN